MTREELGALPAGAMVRFIQAPDVVGTFRGLNWAGLAMVDGPSHWWADARLCGEIERAHDAEYLARHRTRIGAGTHGYRSRRHR